MKGLSLEEIERLAKLPDTPVARPALWTPSIQFGPIRWQDKELRCSSRGCGTATYMKVRGIPRCMMHGLHELNEVCVENSDRIEEYERKLKEMEQQLCDALTVVG